MSFIIDHWLGTNMIILPDFRLLQYTVAEVRQFQKKINKQLVTSNIRIITPTSPAWNVFSSFWNQVILSRDQNVTQTLECCHSVAVMTLGKVLIVLSLMEEISS